MHDDVVIKAILILSTVDRGEMHRFSMFSASFNGPSAPGNVHQTYSSHTFWRYLAPDACHDHTTSKRSVLGKDNKAAGGYGVLLWTRRFAGLRVGNGSGLQGRR
jgi:hypothetical protein